MAGRSSWYPSEGNVDAVVFGGRPLVPRSRLPGSDPRTPRCPRRSARWQRPPSYRAASRGPGLWGGLAARAGQFRGRYALYHFLSELGGRMGSTGGGSMTVHVGEGRPEGKASAAGHAGHGGGAAAEAGHAEPAARAERPGRARAAARRRAAHPGAAVRAHRGVQGHRLPDARQAGGTRPGDDRGRAGGRPRAPMPPCTPSSRQAPTWLACTWSWTWSAPPSRT